MTRSSTPNKSAGDPFHRFRAPASAHLEITPAEFKALFKENARIPPTDDGQDGTIRAASFLSRSTLSRIRSALSRQYQSRGGGHVEDESIELLERNTSFARNKVPQLTTCDLQKLEELVGEATARASPFRQSYMVAPCFTAIENIDIMPDVGDEADVPRDCPTPRTSVWVGKAGEDELHGWKTTFIVDTYARDEEEDPFATPVAATPAPESTPPGFSDSLAT
ncbi:hypothetical protein NMY22_g14254 [Coprinellus aureogranulatus]|nr:hypothetical protein NMY22_g14254 [Coprinellus aureogranulatus]